MKTKQNFQTMMLFLVLIEIFIAFVGITYMVRQI